MRTGTRVSIPLGGCRRWRQGHCVEVVDAWSKEPPAMGFHAAYCGVAPAEEEAEEPATGP